MSINIFSHNKLQIMNKFKFCYLLFITALFLTSCSNDTDDSLNSAGHQITQDSKTVLRSSNDDDRVIIESFYDDILSLQAESGFYDEFYNQHGYFEWTTYQMYNLPNGDPILVMPVTKDRETLSTGVMLYHKNNIDKKFSFISRADILLAIAEENTSEIKDIQLDLLLLSDMHRGSGLQEDLFIDTRDGDEEETPCVGGEFVEFCVRFSGNLSEFAQQHNNFQSFLDDQLEDINFQGLTPSEQAQWLIVLADLDGSTLSSLLSFDAHQWAMNHSQIGTGGYDNALKIYNTYVLARLNFFQNTGIGQEKEGVKGQYITNTSVASYFECFDVWIWCWEEYPDFELSGIVVNSKSTGTSIPAYQKNYNELMFCEGYEEPHDTGADNPDSVHPNYEFCKKWMTYLEDCILPNTELAEGYNGGYQHLIMQWAQFQYYFPDDFNQAIEDSEGCGTTTNSLPPAITEECRDILNAFEDEYDIDLNIADRKAILFGIDCESLECVTSSPEMVDAVLDLLDSDIAEPCAPNKTTQDIVNDLLMSMGEDCDLGKLESALAGSDYIDFGTLKEDCPCLYEYFNNLTENENENWLCSILNEMNDVDKAIFFQDFELTDGDKFQTIPGWVAGKATMLVPTSACEGNSQNEGFPDIDPNSLIGAQFIHEFFHSYLVKIWSENNEGSLPDDFYIWTTDPETGAVSGYPNTEYYIDLVESFAEGEIITGEQHVLFFTHLKDLIINSLHSLNGGQGNPSDYEYYFHLLINTPNLVENHPTFAEDAGFEDTDGNSFFDISDYLDAWIGVDGAENGAHLLFDPNCN